MSQFECLDFEPFESAVNHEEQEALTIKQLFFRSTLRWIVVLLIGIGCALMTTLLAFFMLRGTHFHYALVQVMIEKNDGYILPFVVYVAFSMLLAFTGAMCMTFEPACAGSGVPLLKTLLNGARIPFVIRLKTLVVKFVSLLFCICSGLFIGVCGPLIHMTAILGNGISQLSSKTLGCELRLWEFLRNDRDKRDYLYIGCSTGAASILGAPIGGVMFSLEGTAYPWNEALVWSSCVCSVLSTFLLNILLSLINGRKWHAFGQLGLVSLGFGMKDSYEIYEFPFFILLGIIGGLVGACFVYLILLMNKRVRARINPNHKRLSLSVLEVLVIAFFTSFLSFLLPLLADVYFHDCRPMVKGISELRQFYCPKGMYSPMGTVIFNPQPVAVRQLISGHLEISTLTLFVFFVVYFVCAFMTYGTLVPGGLVIPSLVIGATAGRLFASLLHSWGMHVDFPVYAVTGAAAVFSAVFRMPVACTILIIEALNDIRMIFPIAVAVVVSNWVANLFVHGIHEAIVAWKGLPFLEEEVPRTLQGKRAYHIMSSPVVSLPPLASVEEIANVLLTTHHNGFPVCLSMEESTAHRVVVGIVLRSQLAVLLARKAYVPTTLLDEQLPAAPGLPDADLPFPRSPRASPARPSFLPPGLAVEPDHCYAFHFPDDGRQPRVHVPSQAHTLRPTTTTTTTTPRAPPTAQRPRSRSLSALGAPSLPRRAHTDRRPATPTSTTPPVSASATPLQAATTPPSPSPVPALQTVAERPRSPGPAKAPRSFPMQPIAERPRPQGPAEAPRTFPAMHRPPAIQAPEAPRSAPAAQPQRGTEPSRRSTELSRSSSFLAAMGGTESQGYFGARFPAQPAAEGVTPDEARKRHSIVLQRRYLNPSIAEYKAAVARAERGEVERPDLSLWATAPALVPLRPPNHGVQSLPLGGTTSLALSGRDEMPPPGDGERQRPSEHTPLLTASATSHQAERSGETNALLTPRDFLRYYPRFPDVRALAIPRADLGRCIDLTFYMNETPLTVGINTPLPRVYQLFRTLSLRHLCVTDYESNVVGVITRKDLLKLAVDPVT